MAYHGRQYRGAARDLKANKRREAEERNALTPDHRRASFSRQLEAGYAKMAAETPSRPRRRRSR